MCSITTRRGGFDGFGPVMDLDVIDLPDAVRLLRTRLPDLEQATGEAIAEELGRLPLALEQAAAYMKRAQEPSEEYLELLRSRAADLFARGRVSSRTDTIATVWNVSLDRAAAENPAAVQLLEICSYLAPEPVPLDLFTAHAARLPAPLSPPPATGWPLTTRSPCWWTTRWPNAPPQGSRCTGSSRPLPAPAATAPGSPPSCHKGTPDARHRGGPDGTSSAVGRARAAG